MIDATRYADAAGALRHLTSELDGLARANRLRERPAPRAEARQPSARHRINLCSNDYLGYAMSGRLRAAAERAASEHWTGAAASRLVCGEHEAHRALEREIANWLGTAEAVVFTSGYAANVGVIAALAGPGDLIVSDTLNHASIIDGCRLSGARVAVVPHCSPEAVRLALKSGRERRRWVVTETHFSMDGDRPDLPALRTICDEFDAALVIDEAHAIGVWGEEGRGLASEVGVTADVLIATLGKAVGAQGAFVAGSAALCAWLWNRARTFVFSTGLSPIVAEIARAGVCEVRRDSAGRARLRAVSREFAGGLRETRMATLSAEVAGPILPIVLGGEEIALEASRALLEWGVEVQAIRPPSVPEGSARLRVALNAELVATDVNRALAAFRAVLGRR